MMRSYDFKYKQFAATVAILVSFTAAWATPVFAAPAGDNGDVKTHNVSTAVTDQRDEPKVCSFYLDAFNFDAAQSVNWHIVKDTHGDTVLTGAIVLANGDGHTTNYSLPEGMYKLYWNFQGEHGSAKHKVFKVDCAPTTPVTPGTPVTPVSPTTPVGRGGGQVLSAETVAPAAAQLVNTGTNVALTTASAVAIMLMTAATFFYAPKRQNNFDDISI